MGVGGVGIQSVGLKRTVKRERKLEDCHFDGCLCGCGFFVVVWMRKEAQATRTTDAL